MQISIGDSAAALIKTPKAEQLAESWNRPRSSRELKSFIEQRYNFLPDELDIA